MSELALEARLYERRRIPRDDQTWEEQQIDAVRNYFLILKQPLQDHKIRLSDMGNIGYKKAIEEFFAYGTRMFAKGTEKQERYEQVECECHGWQLNYFLQYNLLRLSQDNVASDIKKRISHEQGRVLDTLSAIPEFVHNSYFSEFVMQNIRDFCGGQKKEKQLNEKYGLLRCPKRLLCARTAQYRTENEYWQNI